MRGLNLETKRIIINYNNMEDITEDVLKTDPNTPKKEDGSIDYIALLNKANKDKETIESNFKTTEFQKEHFRNKFEELDKKFKELNPEAPKENTNKSPIEPNEILSKVDNVQKALMVESFLRKHPDLTDEDITLMEKIKDDKQSLEDVYKSEYIQTIITKRKENAEIEKAKLKSDGRSPIGPAGNADSAKTREGFINSLPPKYKKLYENKTK